MLDPNETAGVQVEEQEEARDQKGQRIATNGLRSARQLHASNPTADISALKAAVEKLIDSKPVRNVEVEARQTFKDLDQAAPSSAA